jgi:hypothetical protein
MSRNWSVPANASHASNDGVKELILPFFRKEAPMGGGNIDPFQLAIN